MPKRPDERDSLAKADGYLRQARDRRLGERRRALAYSHACCILKGLSPETVLTPRRRR